MERMIILFVPLTHRNRRYGNVCYDKTYRYEFFDREQGFEKLILVSDKNNSMKIPGVSFSLKRALGITQMKQKFARETGIPTSKAGLERKIGNAIIKALLGKK